MDCIKEKRMKVEIFGPTRLTEDIGGEIRIDTQSPIEPPYMNPGKISPMQFKTDYYHVNVIKEQRVINRMYDRENHELERLIVKGYRIYDRIDQPPHYKFLELVRKIVIQDPMINKILENKNIKQDGYLTQNLELMGENRYIDNLLKSECIRSIKTRDKIRKMSFIDRIFRWKKITKEIMEM